MSNKKTPLRSGVEGVRFTGKDSDWQRLPGRLRTIIKNGGLRRISEIRSHISEDAGLPMPQIDIAPVCWTDPAHSGVVYAFIRPAARHNNPQLYTFAVFLSAAVLVSTPDNRFIRRVLCHEFAHCFAYLERMVDKMLSMTDKAGMSIDFCHKEPDWLPPEDDRARDQAALVDPVSWFGQWDIEQFLSEADESFTVVTNKIRSSWIAMGLPVEVLERKFSVSGTFGIEDEIIEHFRAIRGLP